MRINSRATDRALAPSKSAHEGGLIGACAAALGRMASTLRDIGSGSPADKPASPEAPVSTSGSRAPPHLSKLTTVVESAAHHADRAAHCHRGAGIRIDAALYELEQLRMELQFVVDPALLQGTSRLLDGKAASCAMKSGEAVPTAPEPVTAAPAESARSAA